MYIDIGMNTIIRYENIVGIFDLDTSTVSKKTRDMLSFSEKNGKVINVCMDLPKSFIIYNDRKNQIIYICQYLSSTIVKRIVEDKN